MNSGGRAYDMTARAKAAEATGQRILGAMQALFAELPYARITLEAVAERAGVTLQTVLRRFGSKQGLLVAAAAQALSQVQAQRAQAPAGDVPGATRVLFDHYEQWGRVALRLLAEEELSSEIAVLTREGRKTHADWVEGVFGSALRGRRGAAKELLRSQLVALTDVYIWKILRSDRGLPRPQAERAMAGMLEALLASSARES